MKPVILSIYLLLLLASLPSLPAAEGPAPATRPNIIFILTDDQRDNTLGAMGHPFVQTPNLDRLMRDSVRFRNTYVAEPVCAPSRVSFFTGMHERVHGVGFSSSYDLTEAQWERSYPALLRRSGYHSGFVGKFGVEYYTFKGRAAEKFDYWWAHDGWTDNRTGSGFGVWGQAVNTSRFPAACPSAHTPCAPPAGRACQTVPPSHFEPASALSCRSHSRPCGYTGAAHASPRGQKIGSWLEGRLPKG